MTCVVRSGDIMSAGRTATLRCTEGSEMLDEVRTTKECWSCRKISSSGDVQRRCTDGDATLDADMKKSDKYRQEAMVMMSAVCSSGGWLVLRERRERSGERQGQISTVVYVGTEWADVDLPRSLLLPRF